MPNILFDTFFDTHVFFIPPKSFSNICVIISKSTCINATNVCKIKWILLISIFKNECRILMLQHALSLIFHQDSRLRLSCSDFPLSFQQWGYLDRTQSRWRATWRVLRSVDLVTSLGDVSKIVARGLYADTNSSILPVYCVQPFVGSVLHLKKILGMWWSRVDFGN